LPRVLHVDDQHGWRGGEQQMLYLARGLAERGLRTAVAVQPASPAAARARQAGLDVCELRMRGEADLLAALRIARIARSAGFNLLHAHTAHAHSLVVLAACLWRAPCKVVVHRRIEFPAGRGAFGLGRLKYRFGVDAYMAISNRVKQTLLDAGVPEWKVFPVHSSTAPERFAAAVADPAVRAELGVPQDAFVVGNIGALVGHKDHGTLLTACRAVRDELPRTWVVIVGEGPLRGSIQERARALGMADRLVLAGFRSDVPRLIRAFDVFALSSSEEGMCSVLAEVAASGCPIVATDAGGVREVVLPDRTGVVVPVRDPAALARGILRLVRDPEEARLLAARGKERVLAHFTAHTMVERTLDVYRRVLEGRVGPEWPVGFCTD
jgi:glycosyltransferase involved in cell wall biosynthesis